MSVLQYRRLPAALVLGTGALLMLALLLVPTGRTSSTRTTSSDDQAGIDQRIAAGEADAATWLGFAHRLDTHGRHAHAAAAYQQVLSLDPYHREARIGRVGALARAGDDEALYRCLRELTVTDPPLALDLLSRAEVKPFLAQPRFHMLAQDARTQAID